MHTWTGTYLPGNSVYLLPGGELLRAGNINNPNFPAGGRGGNLEKYDWDNNLIWTYDISTDSMVQHHDICPLPNGNILVTVWEKESAAAALAEGRNPNLIGGTVWTEKIMEIQPLGADSGTIVWEWNIWDHLVQDYDAGKNNYGIIEDAPERIDFNYNPSGSLLNWVHMNSLDYNPELDQVIMSSHRFSEIWIIDHSTTRSEAASHSGGNSGKGGDLLYRWGNPQTYNRGDANDRKFYTQHNAQWIKPGLPGAGNILVFNNGVDRPEGNYSSIEEILLPVDLSGNYSLEAAQAYLPEQSSWTYIATVPTDFFSHNVSGAQRLDNGHTVICEGNKGTFFEIDENNNVVWKYINPVTSTGPVSQGTVMAAGVNSVFRCSFYAPDYSAFSGRDLTPGNPVELDPQPYDCDLTVGNNKVETVNFNVSLFPNPFNNEINIVSENNLNEVSIELKNATGQLVFKKMNVKLQAGISLPFKFDKEIPPGIYYLSIISKQRAITEMMVK